MALLLQQNVDCTLCPHGSHQKLLGLNPVGNQGLARIPKHHGSKSADSNVRHIFNPSEPHRLVKWWK